MRKIEGGRERPSQSLLITTSTPLPKPSPSHTTQHRRMVECKRCYLTIAAMKKPSSSKHSISKKRKTTIATTDSTSFELCSFDTQFPDTTFSLKASVSSTRTVVSDHSCCSSTPCHQICRFALSMKGFFKK